VGEASRLARYLFFSGKGGVGKTSLASATAVRLAGSGQRTLLVTTDPASNLAEVFEQAIGPRPLAIAAVPGLDAQEIDADAAARAYRENALAPLRGVLPEDMLATMEEQMSGPCTVEIAGFDEFVACMFDDRYDWVIFDTAPTGHTLRLLELPAAWSVHIEESAQGSGQTCIGPVEQLQTSKEQYDEAMRRLREPERTLFVFVAQPERTAVAETLRASHELREIGIGNQRLIINGVIPEEAADHPFFRSRRQMQREAIGELEAAFPAATAEVPLLADEVKGVAMLHELGKWVDLDVYAVR
jgi:arsenite-transporting ATPase